MIISGSLSNKISKFGIIVRRPTPFITTQVSPTKSRFAVIKPESYLDFVYAELSRLGQSNPPSVPGGLMPTSTGGIVTNPVTAATPTGSVPSNAVLWDDGSELFWDDGSNVLWG